jgi:hypothetical protein
MWVTRNESKTWITGFNDVFADGLSLALLSDHAICYRIISF